MARKREQRLRRKARAQARAAQRQLADLTQQLADERARHDAQVIAIRAPAAPLRTIAKPVPVRGRDLARDLEVKRRELLNAAKRLGAEANKRRRDPDRVACLADHLDAAAREFVRAELRLNEAELGGVIGAAS